MWQGECIHVKTVTNELHFSLAHPMSLIVLWDGYMWQQRNKQNKGQRVTQTCWVPKGERLRLREKVRYTEREREREWGEHCVIHGDFYCLRKVSPPVTVQNQLGVAHTVAGNTTFVSHFISPSFSFTPPLSALVLLEMQTQTHRNGRLNLKERGPQ